MQIETATVNQNAEPGEELTPNKRTCGKFGPFNMEIWLTKRVHMGSVQILLYKFSEF